MTISKFLSDSNSLKLPNSSSISSGLLKTGIINEEGWSFVEFSYYENFKVIGSVNDIAKNFINEQATRRERHTSTEKLKEVKSHEPLCDINIITYLILRNPNSNPNPDNLANLPNEVANVLVSLFGLETYFSRKVVHVHFPGFVGDKNRLPQCLREKEEQKTLYFSPNLGSHCFELVSLRYYSVDMYAGHNFGCRYSLSRILIPG